MRRELRIQEGSQGRLHATDTRTGEVFELMQRRCECLGLQNECQLCAGQGYFIEMTNA